MSLSFILRVSLSKPPLRLFCILYHGTRYININRYNLKNKDKISISSVLVLNLYKEMIPRTLKRKRDQFLKKNWRKKKSRDTEYKESSGPKS